MANVQAFIRSTKKDSVNIRFRLSDGRNVQLFYTSSILVSPELWDNKNQCIKPRVLIKPIDRNRINSQVVDCKNAIAKAYDDLLAYGDEPTSDNLVKFINNDTNPLKPKTDNKNQIPFFDLFQKFISEAKVSSGRLRVYNVVFRSLQRYQIYCQLTIKKNIQFNIHSFDVDLLNGYERYLFEEVLIYEEYPQIFSSLEYKGRREKPTPKGQNTISSQLRVVRTFFNWARKNKLTTNYPFGEFTFVEEVYGTPYLLSIEERNNLYHYNMSNIPRLEQQRDIFIFQCVIGCRASDLLSLTKSNIINGAVEYIADKKKTTNPITIRVPLNSIAQEIIEKYKDYDEVKLLPFISEQKYNEYIKEAFTVAGINRMVTVLNPLTRMQEHTPINLIASTHLARRTFIGNLYNKVQDPNLIGSMTGHVEGSKAFARYRTINDDIKTDLVNLLE